MNINKTVDGGKLHESVVIEKLMEKVSNEDIANIVKSANIKDETEVENKNSVQHKYPTELTKIFKTLGMHAPTGIRPPGAAVHRAKMNMRRKAARGR